MTEKCPRDMSREGKINFEYYSLSENWWNTLSFLEKVYKVLLEVKIESIQGV